MSFHVRGLDAALFSPLFNLSEAELSAIGAIKVVADESDAYPCRVSLTRVEKGRSFCSSIMSTSRCRARPIAPAARSSSAARPVRGITGTSCRPCCGIGFCPCGPMIQTPSSWMRTSPRGGRFWMSSSDFSAIQMWPMWMPISPGADVLGRGSSANRTRRRLLGLTGGLVGPLRPLPAVFRVGLTLFDAKEALAYVGDHVVREC